MTLTPGEVIGPLELGAPAHGGSCVARWEGQVVFVRHGVPGESVTVRLTEVKARFARGDVVQVLQASPARREAPCPIASQCGGCDLQHLGPGAAAAWKSEVVAGLLSHAGIDHAPQVEIIEPAQGGWRRRMRYHADAQGRIGLRGHRSHEVVPLPNQGCLIADPAIARPQRSGIAVAADSEVIIGADPKDRRPVTEVVHGHSFEVAASGFWQSHVRAPEVLWDAVVDALAPTAGEFAFDLYCGVGLFSAALARHGVQVWGVEFDKVAIRAARRNVSQARFSDGDVARVLDRMPVQTDLVVLDPPRSGAGRVVLEKVVARRPRAIAYVACDPAALARDLALAATLGYRTESVRAFDLFGMTHHVEALALLVPEMGRSANHPSPVVAGAGE